MAGSTLIGSTILSQCERLPRRSNAKPGPGVQRQLVPGAIPRNQRDGAGNIAHASRRRGNLPGWPAGLKFR